MPPPHSARRLAEFRHQPLPLRTHTCRQSGHQNSQCFGGETIEKKTRYHRVIFVFGEIPLQRIRLVKSDFGIRRQTLPRAGNHRPAGFHTIHFYFRKLPRQFRHKPAIALAHREHAPRIRQPRQQIIPAPQQSPPECRILQPSIRPREAVKRAVGILLADRGRSICWQSTSSTG